MCSDVSGFCHRYSIVNVSRNRVTVEYSNPNEYGTEYPMRAQFPCYANGSLFLVVLDITRITGDNWDGEGWQAFTELLDAPARNPNETKAA